MASRVQKNPQQRAANLSFQLLKTSSTDPSFFSKKSIQSLQELGKRVMIANQRFENKRQDNQSAKQWSSQKGVNLNELRDVARKLKNQQNRQRIQTEEFSDWNQLEYQHFNELSPQDFLFKCQQRLAYYSIMSSLTNTKPTSHLSNLRKSHFNSIAFVKSNQRHQKVNKKEKKIDLDDTSVIQQIKQNYFLPNNLVPFHEICLKTELIRVKLWFGILYNQIRMTQQLGNESDKRNYILVISLKELEKNNKENNEDKRNFTNQYWRSVYNEYRKGGTNFRPARDQQQNQILEYLISTGEKIENFTDIVTPNSIQFSKKDPTYLKALKSLLKGKFIQDITDNIIDQTWLLIFSEGLSRKGAQNDQKNRFKQSIQYLMEKYMQYRQQYFQEILACLIALGAYEELMKFYRTLVRENSLSEGKKVTFSIIFILLANNIELVQQLNLSSSTRSEEQEKNTKYKFDVNKNSQIAKGNKRISKATIGLVKEFFEQLTNFAQINKQNEKSYRFYLKIIAQTAQKAEEQYRSIQKLSIFSLLSEQLTPSLQDLTFMSEECNATARLAKNLLSKIRPYRIQDYLELARLCKYFDDNGDTDIIDNVFINFILLQEANEGRSADLTPHQNEVEGDSIMRELLEELGGHLRGQNRHIVNFISSYRQLKSLLENKCYEDLASRQRAFEKYLQDVKLLELLSNFCQKERVASLDIFVRYCKEIKTMWKFLYLQRRQIEQLRKKYHELARLLKSHEKKYSFLKGQLLAELVYELEK